MMPRRAQHRLRITGRRAEILCRIRLMGTAVARDFHEQQPLVGKVAVKRRLGHTRSPGNVIHAGPFKAMRHEDVPCALQNLIVFAPFSRAGGCLAHGYSGCCGHAANLCGVAMRWHSPAQMARQAARSPVNLASILRPLDLHHSLLS